MKRWMTGILAAVLVCVMVSAGASALAPHRHGNAAGTVGWGSCGVGFVDEDGDGVCDNWDGVCAGGCGVGFVDEDGDGVCDNWHEGCLGGHGQAMGQGGCRTGSCPRNGTGLHRGWSRLAG